MSRAQQHVFLAHWHAGEARERARKLAALGYRVTVAADDGQRAARSLRQATPDALVVDLGRLPSHGRQLVHWLRSTKAVRCVPVVAVAGDAEKTARFSAAFPDVPVTDWPALGKVLARAILNPPKAPAVPQRIAYSGTPLPQKLGIRPGASVLLLRAPAGFARTLGTLPEGARCSARVGAAHDVIVAFCRSRDALAAAFAKVDGVLAAGGGLWIAWPKQASGVATDLTEDVVRTQGLATGLVDNKVCAIDATWSGLRFMARRAR